MTKTATKTVVVRKDRRLAWGSVMPKVGAREEDSQKLAIFCNQVAEVYGVPSLGVNAQGGNPYLNKDGRLYLLNELRKGARAVKSVKTEFVQLSTGLDIPAIVKKTIVFKDGVEIEAIGEASKDNVKLDAVKKTLNMMAETRAMNRAIWQAIAGDVWNRVAVNMARIKGLTPEEKARLVRAGSVSAEEMEQPVITPDTFVATTPEETISDLKAKVDSTNDVAMLMDYAEKLSNAKMPKKVKDEVNAYISKKVDVLSNG